MRTARLSLLCAAAFAAIAINSAAAQVQSGATKKPQAAPTLRLPVYNAELLEITTERLNLLERTLRGETNRDSATASYNVAADKYRAWEKCRDDARMNFEPGEQTGAQMEANAAALEKLGLEYAEKMKNAKTAQEIQRLAAEMTQKQQALMAPVTQMSADYQRHVGAKCGAEPPKPATLGDSHMVLPPGYGLMIERISGHCREGGPSYVGPDGSLSTHDTPYRGGDKGSMFYNVEVYSPAESRLLTERCGTLAPLLKSRGLGMW